MNRLTVFFAVISCLVGHACYSQDDSTKNEIVKITCFGKDIEFSLPKGYKSKRVHYVEGSYDIFYYADSTILTIQCGGSITLPLLTGSQYSVDLQNKNHRSGQIVNSNRFWREDNLGLFNVCYEYVAPEQKVTFDEVMKVVSKQIAK